MSSAEDCINECKYGDDRPKVKHYQQGSIEPIDYINANNLNFNIGNVIKYVTRAGLKTEDAFSDLEKAIDYLNFEIERINNKEKK